MATFGREDLITFLLKNLFARVRENWVPRRNQNGVPFFSQVSVSQEELSDCDTLSMGLQRKKHSVAKSKTVLDTDVNPNL